MDNRLTPKYEWTDDQLTAAVKDSKHWRGVLRALGIDTNPESTLRRVRHDVARLQLDVSHFRGNRSWNDADLIRAVTEARTWDDVLTSLGIGDPRKETRLRLKGHAVRLGLDLSHLEIRSVDVSSPARWAVDLKHLRDAGLAIAAAWFRLRGCVASLPMEQAAYDLLVQMPDGISRVQVKTTTSSGKNGWAVQIGRRPYSARNLARLTPYDPDAIDLFFIVDADMTMYLIPSRAVAGLVGILLRTYTAYIVGNASGLLAAAAAPGAA